MTPPVRRASHKRLGLALASLAEAGDLALQLEAGLHLIRGGDEVRGADMIALVTQDSIACNVLVANLYPMGEGAEAALKVYRNARRSKRDRMPLLSALAQAGYYEHYRWAEPYGDDALDVAEELSGLGFARRARPFVGAPCGARVRFGHGRDRALHRAALGQTRLVHRAVDPSLLHGHVTQRARGADAQPRPL